MGLVAHVFDEQQLQALPGEVAIGHTRYSTTGANKWANAQPLIHHGSARTIALGHNGNLVNVEELRAELIADGIRLASGSDTELIAALIARDPAPLVEAVANTMRRLEGAYSVTALVDDTLVAFRDPFGFRPLTLGRLGDDWVVASETCALDLIGAEVVRDVQPGRGRLGRRGRAARGAGRSRRARTRSASSSTSTSRGPDSRVGGVEVHGARVRMGERLAREAPAEADLVIGVADGGHACGDRLLEGLRDPVQRGADQEPLRRAHVHPARAGHARAGHPDEVQPARRGRGEAHRRRRRLDRPREHDAPARRRCSSTRAPPRCTSASRRRPSSRRASTGSTWPTRTSSRPRTARSRRCARYIGATSLHYLSVEGMQAATELPEDSVCRACFTRDYPTRVPPKAEKLRFEPATA